uniref:Family with sequence similarity 234 member B n=1 Tax=Salarias fasciatus TaxID=181472 RepID=A0A672IVS8_SALFA
CHTQLLFLFPAGKKGSELGEYDPLTQADSEDESEEDDLVLNYPRNGLGRDGGVGGGSSKTRGSRHAVRSAFFLVPLLCATLLVLLCAFLIPCQKGELEKKLQWERALGDAGGVTPPALALWDLDGDSVEDVILGVTAWSNDTRTVQGNKSIQFKYAVAVSAVSGQELWRKVMSESVMSVQCGLQYTICSSSEEVFIKSRATIKVSVHFVQIHYITILPYSDFQSLDLSLTLISGLTGAILGHPVPFNLSGQGKLIGPMLHETHQGAYYIVFGLGNVEAISLRDVYSRATGKMPIAQALRRRDPGWEGLKKNNSSPFVHIYRGSDGVDFLLPLVAGFGNNRNSLDTASNLNSTRSDWVLVSGSSKLSVLRQRDRRKGWTFNLGPVHIQPAPGHFNEDGILDVFSQSSENYVMKAQIVDGANGQLLWSAEFVCPRLVLETSTISTSTGQSAFLFWASEPIRARSNATKTTVTAQPLIRKLFLLHPVYPTILLELSSTTDTAVTSAVSYLEHLKDATYITVSSRPTPDSEPGARIVKSMSLRAAIASGQIVRLGESGKAGSPLKPSVFEINKFFRRLSFKRQVRKPANLRYI